MEEHNMPHTVMGVFRAFGAHKHRPYVRLTKIGCVEGHSPKIPVGHIVEGYFASEVRVGLSFNVSKATLSDGTRWNSWCSSIIQKILTENTFQTKNSIYKWEIINK